jgi:formamidopyrimidine-DNA glycosylase
MSPLRRRTRRTGSDILLSPLGYEYSVPELPEVESARAVIERSALHRRIVDVDDTDTWVCRPHSPGELRDALVGHELTSALRRGKSIWCETSGGGPRLGIHLGMSGRIHVSRPGAEDDEGGDYVGPGGTPGTTVATKSEWDRFTLRFEDGGDLRLFDKRRLGRVRLDPDIDALGPDAAEVRLAEFREILGRSRAPVKARLMDQGALAGVGNLLADEALWQAAVDPRRPADELSREQLAVLHRKVRAAIRHAIRHGGVHTGEVVPHRRRGGLCPRCGAPMERATVGGRTTWFCSKEQG